MRASLLALAIVLASLLPLPVSALVVERIGPTVRRHTSDVRICYVRALRLRPDLRGRIVVRFTVDEAGAVRDVSADSDSVGDPSMQQCVLDVVRAWHFPAGTESETVAYPFEFSL